jgi:NAD(P)-dependent dehydrogenase (short-subunit alcohol dehydrogenase family)
VVLSIRSKLNNYAEVAAAALFLASGRFVESPHEPIAKSSFVDDSSYVNGQCIAVDGGLSSSLPVAPGRFA